MHKIKQQIIKSNKMGKEIRELKEQIAASLWFIPCIESDLFKRDFLKNRSNYMLQRIIQQMENDGAIRYKGEVLHIKKSWAKKNLKDYEIDFRTEYQKWIDGLSDFALASYKSSDTLSEMWQAEKKNRKHQLKINKAK